MRLAEQDVRVWDLFRMYGDGRAGWHLAPVRGELVHATLKVDADAGTERFCELPTQNLVMCNSLLPVQAVCTVATRVLRVATKDELH